MRDKNIVAKIGVVRAPAKINAYSQNVFELFVIIKNLCANLLTFLKIYIENVTLGTILSDSVIFKGILLPGECFKIPVRFSTLCNSFSVQLEVKYNVEDTITSETLELTYKGTDTTISKEQFIFISYSSKDIERINPIINNIYLYSYPLWMAIYNITSDDWFPQSIRNALSAMNCFIVFLSPESVKSPWVADEIRCAVELHEKKQKKCIIPVILEECLLPDVLTKFNPFGIGISDKKRIEEIMARIENN